MQWAEEVQICAQSRIWREEFLTILQSSLEWQISNRAFSLLRTFFLFFEVIPPKSGITRTAMSNVWMFSPGRQDCGPPKGNIQRYRVHSTGPALGPPGIFCPLSPSLPHLPWWPAATLFFGAQLGIPLYKQNSWPWPSPGSVLPLSVQTNTLPWPHWRWDTKKLMFQTTRNVRRII